MAASIVLPVAENTTTIEVGSFPVVLALLPVEEADALLDAADELPALLEQAARTVIMTSETIVFQIFFIGSLLFDKIAFFELPLPYMAIVTIGRDRSSVSF